MNDEAVERINDRINTTATVFGPKPNRAGRRRGKATGRHRRGVALAQKPWAAPSFPQVYDIDKRGNVRGTA